MHSEIEQAILLLRRGDDEALEHALALLKYTVFSFSMNRKARPQLWHKSFVSEKGVVMTVERALRILAGAFVTISVALGYWVSPYWFLFTAFVGLNLFQSGFTNMCPGMSIFRKLGLPDAGEARSNPPKGQPTR